MVNATSRPLYPRERPSTFVQEVGWAPEQVWTGAENLVPTGFRTPDRPARSESLYRLSYPGQHIGTLRKLKLSSLRNYHFPILHPSDLSSLQVSPPKPILFPLLTPPRPNPPYLPQVLPVIWFSAPQRPDASLGRLIAEVSKSHAIRHTHTPASTPLYE